MAHDTSHSPVPALPLERRPLALLVVVAVVFINIIDVTILNVALPTIQRELAASDAALQWLVAGYASVYGILLMTGGRLGDIFGYRRVLGIGLAGFLLASLACGLAASPLQLNAARMLQGAMAAVMTPQATSLVQILYRPRERVAVLGAFGILGGVAAVAGPLIGGLLIDADLFGLGWRMIFLVNLPIGIVLFAAALRFLPAGRSRLSPRVDLAGTLLVTLTFAAVIVPLVEGRALGWPLWCLALLAGAPFAVRAALGHSRRLLRRGGSPLLVPTLFRERAFAVGLGMAALFQAAMGGTLFVLTLALQNGLGFSARDVGFAHVPFAVGVAAGVAVLARNALPLLRTRVIRLGAAAMGASLAVVVWQVLDGTAVLWPYLPSLLFLGLGCGTMLGTVSPITLSEVDTDYAGAASGTLRSLHEFGGALGVAIVGGLYLSLADANVASSARIAFAWASGLTIILLSALALVSLAVPEHLQVFESGQAEPDAGTSA